MIKTDKLFAEAVVSRSQALPGNAEPRGSALYNVGGGASRTYAPREDPGSERVCFCQYYDETVNNPAQKEIDELWAKEAEKRVEEIRSGKVKTIPGDEVFKKIRKRLASCWPARINPIGSME